MKMTKELEKSERKVLPASVSVYVVDPIKSVPDARMKAQELKVTIKAEHGRDGRQSPLSSVKITA